jgi:hypothetical protein
LHGGVTVASPSVPASPASLGALPSPASPASLPVDPLVDDVADEVPVLLVAVDVDVLLDVLVELLFVPVVSSPPHPVATAPATNNAPASPPRTLNVAPVNLAILEPLPFKS